MKSMKDMKDGVHGAEADRGTPEGTKGAENGTGFPPARE